jgi:hypothetical protein
MPRVKWDVDDFEEFEDEQDFSKFERIKSSSRRIEEDSYAPPKKRVAPKHQVRVDKL